MAEAFDLTGGTFCFWEDIGIEAKKPVLTAYHASYRPLATASTSR